MLHARTASPAASGASWTLLRLRGLGALGLCTALATTVVAGAGGSPAKPTDVVPAVLQVAKQQVGDGYQWGGNGPDAWDCSGFTSYMWREVGGVKDVPRVSRDQQKWAVPLPAEQLLPGDLVFFGNPVSHVGIALGGGRMVDASSSRKGVVERAIWTSGVVRYGRVPRPGMPVVKPWTPPPPPPLDPAPATAAPAAAPVASGKPAAKPAGKPAGKPTTPAGKPASAPAVTPRTTTKAPALLTGLPGVQRVPSSRVMLKAAAGARSVVGSGAWTDLQLVRVAWRHAGGGLLPDDRAALVARSTPVRLSDARVGDLVVYGAPAQHLAIYLGHGYMVDSSKVLGRVVVRRVFHSDTVRLVRPPVVTAASASAKPAAPRR